LDLRQPPTLCELFKNPALLAANPHFSNILEAFQKGVIFRPAAAAGKKYPEVSRAYYNAVHAVLTHEKTGAKAAADLETELVSITGLKPAMKANASVAQTSERLRK
jgi:trehalose/maltose transport system substrate-binding protein